MTLWEILNKEKDISKNGIHIDYRTFMPDGTDIYTGSIFVTKNGDIIALDHDIYSMNDEFDNYKVEVSPAGETYISCYYKSEWIGE